MKSVLTIAGVVLLTSALLTTVAHAQKTSAGFDKTVNFSNYKTFMFSSTNGARNPYVNEMIITALVRELTARGLTRVEANADLRVNYLAATGFNLQVSNVSFGYAVNPVYSGLISSGSVMSDLTTGTLLIDLFDNKTDRIIFRGTAKDVLQRAPSANPEADAKIVSKPINKGIAKIFKKYPVPGK